MTQSDTSHHEEASSFNPIQPLFVETEIAARGSKGTRLHTLNKHALKHLQLQIFRFFVAAFEQNPTSNQINSNQTQIKLQLAGTVNRLLQQYQVLPQMVHPPASHRLNSITCRICNLQNKHTYIYTYIFKSNLSFV